MILSHTYKCIGVQIRKTGSTSMGTIFSKIDPEYQKLNELYNLDQSFWKHQNATLCRQLAGDTLWNSYYKFSFIREPYSWIKSHYLWTHKMHWPEKQADALYLTFNRQSRLPLVNNTITVDNIISFYTFLKWYYYEVGQVGQVGELSESLDHIGLLEDLEDELEFLRGTLKLPSFDIPRENKTNHPGLSFTPEAHQLVSLLFKDDIAFYQKMKNTPINQRHHVIY